MTHLTSEEWHLVWRRRAENLPGLAAAVKDAHTAAEADELIAALISGACAAKNALDEKHKALQGGDNE